MKTEEVTLEKFTYGGDVFGRLADRRAVFVPFAIPGERVLIRLVEEKQRYARGEIIEVLAGSPARINPVCSHFTQCGGCHYQHLPYKTQTEAKGEILKDQLQRIGKIDSPPVKPTIPAPAPWYYRNHVQFHLTEDGHLGFSALRSNEIIPITECHLPEELIGKVWAQLELDTIPGIDRVGLRVGTENDVLINLECSEPQPIALEVEASVSITYTGPGGTLVLAGDDSLISVVNGHPFKVSAGSFFQVNSAMAGAMVNHILKYLPLSKEALLVDAYCGVGLFSVFLAPRVKQLVGIEFSASACDDFVTNLEAYENILLYEAPVADALSVLDEKPDILLVDPPRSGLDRWVVDEILSIMPNNLVYVSCDPATLGRDLQRVIRGGYTLTQTTPFDLFPQTYHIESISFLCC